MENKIANENYSSISIDYNGNNYILDYELNVESDEFYNLYYLRNLIDTNNNLDIYKFNKCGFTGKFGKCDCCNNIKQIYKNIFINSKIDENEQKMITNINDIIKINFKKSMFIDKENSKNINYIKSLLIENEKICPSKENDVKMLNLNKKSYFFLLKNLIYKDNYKYFINIIEINNKQNTDKKIKEIEPNKLDMNKKTIEFVITTLDNSKFQIKFMKKKLNEYDSTITLTFGEAGENHAGMQLIGKKRNSGDGFSFEKLTELHNKLKKKYKNSELNEFSLDEDYDGKKKAGILIIRNYLEDSDLYNILNEHIEWDNEFIDHKKKYSEGAIFEDNKIKKVIKERLILIKKIPQNVVYDNKNMSKILKIINFFKIKNNNTILEDEDLKNIFPQIDNLNTKHIKEQFNNIKLYQFIDYKQIVVDKEFKEIKNKIKNNKELNKKINVSSVAVKIEEDDEIKIIEDKLPKAILLKDIECIKKNKYENKHFLGKKIEKKARSNIVIAKKDTNLQYKKKDYNLKEKQNPNIYEGKGTIYLDDDNVFEYKKRNIFIQLKDRINEELLEYLKEQDGLELICEGNKYNHDKYSGINWHGDTERRIVIAVRLGRTMSMSWQWYKSSSKIGNEFKFNLNHGDLYIMSEKAVGSDWKSSEFHLRHAAGVIVSDLKKNELNKGKIFVEGNTLLSEYSKVDHITIDHNKIHKNFKNKDEDEDEDEEDPWIMHDHMKKPDILDANICSPLDIDINDFNFKSKKYTKLNYNFKKINFQLYVSWSPKDGTIYKIIDSDEQDEYDDVITKTFIYLDSKSKIKFIYEMFSDNDGYTFKKNNIEQFLNEYNKNNALEKALDNEEFIFFYQNGDDVYYKNKFVGKINDSNEEDREPILFDPPGFEPTSIYDPNPIVPEEKKNWGDLVSDEESDEDWYDDSDNANDDNADNDDDDNANDDNANDDNADDDNADDEINVKNKIYDMLQEYYNNKTSDQWKDSNWKQLGSKLAKLDTENEQKNMRHELKHGGYYEALAICRNIDKVMKEFEPNNLFGFYGIYVNQNNFTEEFKETYNFFIKDSIDKFFNNEIEELKKNKDQYIQKINDLKNILFTETDITIIFAEGDRIKNYYQQYKFLNKIINKEDLEEDEKTVLFEIILSEDNIKSYFGNEYVKHYIDNYEDRRREKEEEFKNKTYLKAVIKGIKVLNCVEKNVNNVFHYESYVEIPSKRNAVKENDDHLKGTYIKFDALENGTLDNDLQIKKILPDSEDKCNYLILLFKIEENDINENDINDYKVKTLGNGENRCWINATLYAFLFGIMEFNNNRQGGGRIIEDKYEDNLLNEIEEDLDNDYKDNLLNEIEEDLDNDFKDNLLTKIEEDLFFESDDSDELE